MADPLGRSALDSFRRWLGEHCNVSGLEKFYFGEFPHDTSLVRGAGAARFIKKAEKVMCVPQNCFIADFTERKKEEENRTRTKKQRREICNFRHRLAFNIADEMQKGDLSRFAPYFNSLPTEEDMLQYHPAYLTDMELHEDVDRWGVKYSLLDECYKGYVRVVGRNAASWSKVKLAYVWLVTRSFNKVGLAPPLDMPNSDSLELLNAETRSYDVTGVRVSDAQKERVHEVCLEASRDIQIGEEILVPYGIEDISPVASFYLYSFNFEAWYHSSEADPQNFCEGLMPDEFEDPGLDSNPIVHNYWRYTKRTCHPIAWGVESEFGIWLLGLACACLFVRAWTVKVYRRLRAPKLVGKVKVDPEDTSAKGPLSDPTPLRARHKVKQ